MADTSQIPEMLRRVDAPEPAPAPLTPEQEQARFHRGFGGLVDGSGQYIPTDSPEHAAELFRSGQASLTPGTHDVVVDGQVFSVPAEKVAGILDAGGRLASRAETSQAEIQEKFANRGGEAFFVNALDAASMGMAKAGALSGTGISGREGQDTESVSAEDFANLEAQNQGWSTAGTVAGMIGPALIPGGEFTAAGATAKLGVAAEQAAAKRLGSSLLAKAGARAIGGATEGAIYGGAQTLTEAALEDRDLTGEALFLNTAGGALFGGAAAAGLGAGTDIAGLALKKAGSTLRDSTKAALGKMFARQAELETGVATQSGIGDLMAEKYAKVAGFLNDKEAGTIKRFIGNSEEAAAARAIANRGDSVIEDGSRKMRQILDETSDSTDTVFEGMFGNSKRKTIQKLMEEDGVNGIATHAEADALLQKIQAQADESIASPDTWGHKNIFAQTYEDAQGVRARIAEALKEHGSSAGSFVQDEMNAFKQRMGRRVRMAERSVGTSSDQAGATRIRSWYEGDPDAGMPGLMKHLENEEIYGSKAAALQTENNKAFHEWFSNEGVFRQGLMRKVGQSGFDDVFTHDPGKLASMISNIGRASNDVAEEAFAKKLATQRHLLETAIKNSGLSEAQMAAAKKGLSSLKRAESEWSKIRKEVGIVNQARDISAGSGAGIGGGAQAMAGAAAGAVLGGMMGDGTGGTVGGALGFALAKPGGVIRLFSVADRARAALAHTSDRAAAGIVSRAMGRASGVAKSTVAALRPVRGPALRLTYQKHAEAIADSIATEERRKKNSDEIGKYAPGVASVYDDRASRATQFLASKLPAPPRREGMFSAIDKRPVSEGEMRKFMDYAQAVKDPMAVLEAVKNGTYKPEHIEAIREVYPAMYARIQAGVVDKLSKLKKPPSYQARLELFRLFGVTTDQSTSPAFIATMQNLTDGPAPSDDPSQKPPARNAKAPSVGKVAMSQTERLLSR